MNVSSGQFYIFLCCVAFGGVSGIIYTFLSFFKKIKIKKIQKYFNIIIDIFSFILITLLYILYSFIIGFPSLRIYMFLGVLCGALLYIKSFHIILAKCIKKVYNSIKKQGKIIYDRRKI